MTHTYLEAIPVTGLKTPQTQMGQQSFQGEEQGDSTLGGRSHTYNRI
jgi:hypothetical protein